MANPQLEDGYTTIANELLEAIYNVHLADYESRIIWFIIRVTYGFGHKTDTISISQFEDGIITKEKKVIVRGTGISHRNICRTLNHLVIRKIIIRKKDGRVTEYGIQKDYSKWLPSDITDSDITDSDISDTKTVTLQTLGSDILDTENSDILDTHQSNKATHTKTTIPKQCTAASLKKYFYSKKRNGDNGFIDDQWLKFTEKYPPETIIDGEALIDAWFANLKSKGTQRSSGVGGATDEWGQKGRYSDGVKR